MSEKRIASTRAQETPDELDRRLMQEINLLKLEGALFCFDPREAKRRSGVLTLSDVRKQPVTVEIHPHYGQPSVLAYKVLQAVFLKLTEQGCSVSEDGTCLYDDVVYFSQRELAALTNRAWSGSNASRQLHHAIMQLRSTMVNASLYDKDADAWVVANLQVLNSAYFAGRNETITRCAVRLAPEVMASLNRRHVAFFNLQRLSSLDTLGLVLYKRLFFHLSNLMQEGKAPRSLRFTKDYEAICREWLGGLKPLRYKSDILKDQLGRHLDAIQATGLIRRYALEKNAKGAGFNLTVYPGKGFFGDYEAYYRSAGKPRRLAAPAELGEVKALELVAHFHRSLGRQETRFQEHETSYADELLATYSEADVRDLIAYSIERAPKTGFAMLYFGALKRFVDQWQENRTRKKARLKAAAMVKDCPFCNEAGYLELKEHATNQVVVHPCPHNAARVSDIEEHLKAFRA